MSVAYTCGGICPRRFLFIHALILLGCFFGLRSADAAEEDKIIYPVKYEAPPDIKKALGSGDVASIDKALENAPNDGAIYILNAMKSRIQGDLKTSSANARKCVSESVGNGWRFAKYGITCYQILAGNYLISNDLYNWSKTYSELDSLVKSMGLSLAVQKEQFKNVDPKRIEVRVLGELDTNFRKFYESESKSSPRLSIVDDKYVLRRDEGQYGQHGFFVFASINGHRIPVLLDTGVTTSAIRNEDSIRDGLKISADDVIEYRGIPDGGNAVKSAAVGFAKDLVIGGVKMGEEYPVLVTTSGPGINVIGLDFFTRFHRVKIGKREISLNPGPEKCTNELRILSSLPGFYRLALKGNINGKDEWIFVDTGTQDALTATAASGLEGKDEVQRDRIVESGHVVIRTSRAEVSLNGKSIPAVVSKDYESYYPYVLGDGALDYFDIYLDLDAMTGCLNQPSASGMDVQVRLKGDGGN